MTLESDSLYYLVEGAGNAYAAVDSHLVINGPLHAALLKSWNDDTPGKLRWVEHRLADYRGHRLHVQFTPHPGKGLAVRMVVQASRMPAPIQSPGSNFVLSLAVGESRTLEDLAAAYQRLFCGALDRFAEGTLRDAAGAHVADWLVRHAELLVTADARASLLAAARRYVEERKKLLAEVKRTSRLAIAMLNGTGVNENLLVRGNPHTPGPVVPRRFLEALVGTNPERTTVGSGRMELARRVTDPTNPLTSRVAVNRVWHHLFGRGIVASVDNFGVLGEPPTHPELLDWLARRFVDQGWSTKGLIRDIARSSAYQMSSQPNPAARELDARNLLWHRRELRRLEGEAIRDAVLAVSGRLQGAMYGRPMPIHLGDFVIGRGRPASGPPDGEGRRSVYLSVRRNFLSPLLVAFDMPQPTTAIGRRNISNVPAQALILLNDPFVVEQAAVWARRMLKVDEPETARVSRLYLEAFARPPTDEESAAALAFLKEQAAAHSLPPGSHDPRPWSDLCHVLLNCKE
ncbi:MAG: DUF1553 domain-containing protein, partial [Pirellulales bacterium]